MKLDIKFVMRCRVAASRRFFGVRWLATVLGFTVPKGHGYVAGVCQPPDKRVAKNITP